ncbi:IS256 family transposase, partial [Burkholderia metallica]|uniref:IS256 family transposase n=1 Tax=Burkholderia metallica TaxID=488729 RepID=UPI003B969CB7
MPMKKKRQTVARQAAARGPLPELPKELLDQLVKGPMSPAEVQDLMLAFNKAVIERAMGAEMNLHLGYPPGQSKPPGQANERNGASGKTVITDRGPVRVEVPRDRDGSFEPILIPKHERRFTGFDERIIAMYARGMSVREIQAFLAESYGTEVSPDFISSVTDEVMAEALSWQSRPLETMYPVVFFDALRVKIRDDGVVSNKAVYLALGIQADGQRDVLGLWIEQTEGAKFWLKVFNELKTRGCQDILIAVVDGLKGLTEAISAAYPRTTVQTCIVHLIRNSLEYASYKDRKALAAALRPIYAAASEEAAKQALQDFADGPWGAKYPTVVQSWQRAWEHVIPFFVFPPEIRRVVYTTDEMRKRWR